MPKHQLRTVDYVPGEPVRIGPHVAVTIQTDAEGGQLEIDAPSQWPVAMNSTPDNGDLERQENEQLRQDVDELRQAMLDMGGDLPAGYPKITVCSYCGHTVSAEEGNRE